MGQGLHLGASEHWTSRLQAVLLMRHFSSSAHYPSSSAVYLRLKIKEMGPCAVMRKLRPRRRKLLTKVFTEPQRPPLWTHACDVACPLGRQSQAGGLERQVWARVTQKSNFLLGTLRGAGYYPGGSESLGEMSRMHVAKGQYSGRSPGLWRLTMGRGRKLPEPALTCFLTPSWRLCISSPRRCHHLPAPKTHTT